MSGIAKRWKVLSGSEKWEGLLDPFDSDLRRYLIHYGSMVPPASEAFINEPASKNVGLSRYTPQNLLVNTGLDKGNPFKYEVTKYFYTPSTIPTPTEYSVRPTRSDAVLKESNWNGYVAVATDDGKGALGRRDILVVWRGTIRESEWIQNFTFLFMNATLIFGENSDPLVHKGWYDMYTAINKDSQLNDTSARDQIREEVGRLVEKYKNEEISITVTGHSLGSSLATLNAIDLAVNPINNDILVTAFLFASPKVGDDNFMNAFSNQHNLRGLRVVHVKDPVPLVPPFGWAIGNAIPIMYRDVGVGLEIDATQSDYMKKAAGESKNGASWHDLMIYLHGIDGFKGPDLEFEPQGEFDVSKLNKYQDVLKEEYHVPLSWFNIHYKGMVQQDDGTWILDDHEKGETF